MCKYVRKTCIKEIQYQEVQLKKKQDCGQALTTMKMP